MEKIKVIILSDGITAKEANPYGKDKPSRDVTYTKGTTVVIGTEKDHIYQAQLANWDRAEKGLRTFEIDSEEEFYERNGGKEKFEEGKIKIQSANVLYEPNSKQYAVVLPSGKIKIVPDKNSFYEQFAKKIDMTPVTEEIYFGYTKLGEPNFIKKGSEWADKNNSISLRDWTPEQLESMASFMRNNPLCTLMNDGSGDLID